MNARTAAFAILALGLAGPGLAEEFKGEAVFPWLAIGTTYTIEEGHPFFVGAFSGINIFKDGAGPLHNSAIQCPGYNDIGVDAGGYCVVTDAGGDKVFLKWQCKTIATAPGDILTCEGATTVTGGTGKFASASGGNEFTSHIIAIHPDGTSSGYSELRDYLLNY